MRSRSSGESAAIEDGANLLRALLEEGGLAIGVVDDTGRLTFMSRGMQELVGASSPGPTVADFPRLFHLFNAEGTAVLKPEEVPVVRATAGETVRDAVISVRRPGEPVRYLRCNAMPLTTGESDRSGAVVLVADVTAEHLAVSRQDSIRGLLLDTVNHELRTPLTVVLANAELIIDATADLPEQLRRPLAAIVRASGRLRDTVQHVTDLVDLEAVAHPVRTETDVAELLHTVADRHRDQAGRRSISVEVDCPSCLVWNLDATLVGKAVAALLDNALTHGPANSSVALSAGVEDDLLRIRLSDHGAGIEPRDQERLIKPFERGSTPAGEARHPRGLGLALAQTVATSHHGVLLLKNHHPHGFTASLVLA